MDRNTFLAAYNIDEKDLEAARISWEELELIEKEYQKIEKLISGRILLMITCMKSRKPESTLIVTEQKNRDTCWKRSSVKEKRILKNSNIWIIRIIINM